MNCLFRLISEANSTNLKSFVAGCFSFLEVIDYENGDRSFFCSAFRFVLLRQPFKNFEFALRFIAVLLKYKHHLKVKALADLKD